MYTRVFAIFIPPENAILMQYASKTRRKTHVCFLFSIRNIDTAPGGAAPPPPSRAKKGGGEYIPRTKQEYWSGEKNPHFDRTIEEPKPMHAINACNQTRPNTPL